MFIDVVPNRDSPPAILLRESYRQGAKVRKKTLANLSHWPPAKIEALRAVLKGASTPFALEDAFHIARTRPHGHVAAVLGSLRKLELDTLIAPKRSRARDLCIAMIVGRILQPRAKLALSRALAPETLQSTLGEVLAIENANEDELYEAMDWLLSRQEAIENALAKRHLHEGSLVLYDLTSTYFEGRHCPLARRGHSRDGKKDKLQIVFGVLTDGLGCPVAIEVFEGNTGDPKTLPSQIQKLRMRFGLTRVVLVGDRGMITSARIEENLRSSPGLEWITALRAPAIQKLVREGALQLSLFDERDLAEITSPDYPGERLVVCRNPLLAEERRRKREELLLATERELQKVGQATTRAKRKLRGKDRIALRVGRVLGRFKMGKHFQLEITDSSFRYKRNHTHIREEAALDGIYVIRTSLPREALGPDQIVRSYKSLAEVERAFRSMKTVDLKVRPIYHRLADRVRAHVFLCMLAYYVEWHMHRALAPMLFDDDDKAAAENLRGSVVAKAQRSPRAEEKALTKRTPEGAPVHSFQTLLLDLATLAKNRVQPKQVGALPFDMLTMPTPLQRQALELLGVRL
jgi:transposase